MASERAGKKWYLVEALGFAALVGMYIWKWQEASPQTWWVLAGWLVVSAVLRHDTPKTLGWRADNLWAATRRAVPFFAIDSVAVCGEGLFLGMLQRLPAHLIEPRRFTGYFAFCVLQQVALNSYLTNRLLGCFEKAWPAAGVAGVIFAALHWPNPVLVPLTLAGRGAVSFPFAPGRESFPLAVVDAAVWEARVAGGSARASP